MEILKLKMREMEYYGEDDTLDCEYFVIKEDDATMEKKLNELRTICGNYDSYEEVEDYISINFKLVEIDTEEFIV